MIGGSRVAEQSLIIITVYEPDFDHWELGFERRKDL